MKFTKKISILIAVIIIILIITNPSYKKFQDYSKEFKVVGVYSTSKKTFEGFLFSIYTKQVAQVGDEHTHVFTLKYLGILSNFFEISRTEKNINRYYIK